MAWKHWCPTGCGKCVVYDHPKFRYDCPRCKQKFSRVELEAIQRLPKK